MAGNIEGGTPGSIRVLRPADLPIFRDHLLRLDPESRFDRFNGVTNDRFVRAYAEKCFSGKTVVYGYVEDGVVHAAAELHHLEREDKAAGEIAFSVERHLQGKGLGSRLFEHLIALARRLGYRQLRVTTHSDNAAMKALARKFNARLTFASSETVGVIHLDQPAGTPP